MFQDQIPFLTLPPYLFAPTFNLKSLFDFSSSSLLFMFQIFSILALPCLIAAPALKPSVQLHLHMENNLDGKEENLHHVDNNQLEKQPSRFLARKAPRNPVKDTHTPKFSHIVVVGGSLPFHNEKAALQTPHTVTTVLGWFSI